MVEAAPLELPTQPASPFAPEDAVRLLEDSIVSTGHGLGFAYVQVHQILEPSSSACCICASSLCLQSAFLLV